MKINLTVSKAERTLIVAALMSYDERELAYRLAHIDPANDGPEVDLLRKENS